MLNNKIAVIIAGILLGLIGIWVKLINKQVPIMTLNWARLTIAFLFFLLFLAPFYRKKIKKFKDIKGAILVGFLMAVAFSLFSTANFYAPATNVALITSLYAVITPIFAWLILKEKLSTKKIIAIFIALTGLIIINPLKTQYLTGNIISLIHPFIFSLFLVYLRKKEKGQDIASMFWFFLFATIFLIPFPFIYGLGNINQSIIYILLLGVLSTAVPYILLAYGLEKVPAPQVSIIILVTLPLSAITFSYLVFRDIASSTIYFGGALLLIAGAIALWNEKHKRYIAHF